MQSSGNAAHVSQLVLPAALHLPGSHSVHSVASLIVEKVATGHESHVTPLMNDPGGHWHVCRPVPAAAESVYPTPHLLQSTVSEVSHNVPLDPDAIVGVPFGQVQVLPTQVCKPVPAEAESVYPARQAEQSIVESVSHNVPPLPDAIVGVPFGHVHVLAVHVNVLN